MKTEVKCYKCEAIKGIMYPYVPAERKCTMLLLKKPGFICSKCLGREEGK